jgi:hypothetical protein
LHYAGAAIAAVRELDTRDLNLHHYDWVTPLLGFFILVIAFMSFEGLNDPTWTAAANLLPFDVDLGTNRIVLANLVSIVVAAIIESYLFRALAPVLRIPVSVVSHMLVTFLAHGSLALGATAWISVWLFFLRAVSSIIATTRWPWHVSWNLAMYFLSVIFSLNFIPLTMDVGGFYTLISGSLGWGIIPLLISHLLAPSATSSGWRQFQRLFDGGHFTAARLVEKSGVIPFGERLLNARPHTLLHVTKRLDPRVVLRASLHKVPLSIDSVVPYGTGIPTLTPILLTNAPMVPPRNDMFSTKLAFLIRTCRHTTDATHPNFYRSVGAQFSSFIRSRLRGSICTPDSFDTWIDSYEGAKKVMVANYVALIRSGGCRYFDPSLGQDVPSWMMTGIRKSGLQAMVKSDEVLYPKSDGIVEGPKARIIRYGKLSWQASTQGYMHAIAPRLKYALRREFSITLGEVTHKFWFSYASGMTGSGLTSWLVEAHLRAGRGVICSIVMGDDSLTMFERNGELVYLEADYSQYDQSQKGVHNDVETLVMQACGAPTTVTDILTAMSLTRTRAQRRNRKSGVVLTIKTPWNTRVTGAPNTSFSNSTNNIVGLIVGSFFDFSEEGWTASGFSAVSKFSTRITDVTFLRGTWWPHLDGTYRWGLLPSAMLKLGKTLSHVRSHSTLQMIAYGMALGIGEVPLSFPILGPFRARMLALGRVSPLIKKKWKPLPAVTALVDIAFVTAWICDRYGLSLGDLQRVDAKIMAVGSLPYFLADTVFPQLARDYM